LDPKPLLRLVLGRFFGNMGGFVDMVAKHVPSPIAGAAMKVCK
jgi:U5 small nuclear ribonucleoprotein component